MPWSNQGGGPWGSGGGSKGPWGSGPQSSGPTPPDLEELLRRSQDKLKNVLPGGSLGNRGFLIIALIAVILWGFSGFFRVEPDEVGVRLLHGRRVMLLVQAPVQAEDRVVLDERVVEARLGHPSAGEADDDDPPLEGDALGARGVRRAAHRVVDDVRAVPLGGPREFLGEVLLAVIDHDVGAELAG